MTAIDKMIRKNLIFTIFLVTFAIHAAALGKRIRLYLLALLHFITKGASKKNLRQHTHVPSESRNANVEACERKNRCTVARKKGTLAQFKI